MIPNSHLLERVGRQLPSLSWDNLSPAVRDCAPLLLMGVVGSSLAVQQAGFPDSFPQGLEIAGGPAESTIWGRKGRVPAAHATFVNGAMAGREAGVGETEAGFRAALAVVPAAIAVAEATGASGHALLEAIVAGCAAGAACSRALLPGVSHHGLDPVCALAGFGSAAATARLLGLGVEATAGALALAGILMPVAPLEASGEGAVAGALCRGWAAFAGVQAAQLARSGLAGPLDLLEAPRDGLGTFLLHASADTSAIEDDPQELLGSLAVAGPAQLRAVFRRRAGAAASGLEKAVEKLAEAPNLGELSAALGVRP